MAQYELLPGQLAVCAEAGWKIPRLEQGLDLEIAHFLDYAIHDRPPLVTGSDGREALRMSLAAQESAKTERIIEL